MGGPTTNISQRERATIQSIKEPLNFRVEGPRALTDLELSFILLVGGEQ
jgi:hypothetical protein